MPMGGLLIMFVANSTQVQKILNGKFFSKFSNLSFYIYLYHDPIIYSLGMIICIYLFNKVSYGVNCLINLTIMYVTIITFTYLYNKYVSKYENKIIKYLDDKLERI